MLDFLMVLGLRIHLPMQETQVDPWSGKAACAMEQLNALATTPEAHAPWSLYSATGEAAAVEPQR